MTYRRIFIDLDNWNKGICFINGFNLGRYWNIEPHRNLYLPGPLLKPGTNEIVIFELEGHAKEPSIMLVDSAENTITASPAFQLASAT